ncbi:hypothetical protein KQI49_01765 [Virgibacillus sp. MSJ-26]|uniref:hypothetical protein n=1 Tax=Virgibacillus sp. MSJ-26 TaxID=2841522 RepID=UPI001C11F95C|nr:hypothetical protein [Virgibacillus sp. MSJ-26]MBU5465553.1 hypothetical protein [Virgibacillus sp. MSJ-26]
MTYKGYSLVGDLDTNDFWKEYMERMGQKEKLRKQIEADLELNKQLFAAYLKHSYAIKSLSKEHQTLSNNVTNHFEGKAKRALTDRFDDNIIKAYLLNANFENFLKHFSTEE